MFGTSDMPLAYTGAPGITGVPVPFRQVENGQFTQLDRPTPFGDKSMAMPNGTMMLKASDVTATDAATTEDEVRFKASWGDKKATMENSVRLPEGAAPFHSGDLEPEEAFEYTFEVPGRYRYFCVPHEAAMRGTVIVAPANGE